MALADGASRPMSGFIHRRIARLQSDAGELLEQGSFAQAIAKQQEACQMARRYVGHDVSAVCGHLSTLAEIHQQAGQRREAREIRLEARNELLEHLRARHPRLMSDSISSTATEIGTRHRMLDYDLETALSLNRLAMLFHCTGGNAQARPLLEKAMAITRKGLGVDHPDFAILLNNLASIERSTGRFETAEALYRQALEALRTTLGERHPELAQSQTEMAQLYRDWDRPQEALTWLEKALDTLRLAAGDHHFEIVEAMQKVAALQTVMGNLTAAEWQLLQARKLLRSRHEGHTGHQVCEALVLQQLAGVYQRIEDYEQAEALCRESLDILERLWGRGHPEMSTGMMSLAELRRLKGHFEEAEELYRQALAIRTTALGEHHPDCAVIMNNLAALYHQTDRLREAEGHYEKACCILRAASAEGLPQLLRSLANLALLHRQKGNLEASEALHQEMEQLRRRRAGQPRKEPPPPAPPITR